MGVQTPWQERAFGVVQGGVSVKVLLLESEQLYRDLLPVGLSQVGCTVQTLSEVLGGELERTMAEFQPDFVLTIGWSLFPTQERLDVIREVLNRYQAPLVYWATEDPLWHEQWSIPYVKRCQPDLVATVCAESVSKYEALGLRAIVLPFGYNDELYRSVPAEPQFACDIAVVANFYTTNFHNGGRKRSLGDLVTPLLERGYAMKIWGHNWAVAPEYGVPLREGVWQGYLEHRETPALYNSAQIVIGLQNEFDGATNLTMRTCEVMGAGGFLLTSRTKAVESLFDDKVHLVMSNSAEETLSLVDYYLANPEERLQIAAAGQAHVRARHTYARRVVALLLEVFRRYTGRAIVVATEQIEEETVNLRRDLSPSQTGDDSSSDSDDGSVSLNFDASGSSSGSDSADE